MNWDQLRVSLTAQAQRKVKARVSKLAPITRRVEKLHHCYFWNSSSITNFLTRPPCRSPKWTTLLMNGNLRKQFDVILLSAGFFKISE